MPLWDEFLGLENSIENLLRKAKALSEMILVGSDSVIKLAAIACEAQVDDDAKRRSCAEWLALKLRLIERVSSSLLRPAQLDVFMEALIEGVVAAGYELDPLTKEQVRQLLESYDYYAQFPNWLPEQGESARGSLLWSPLKSKLRF